MVRESTEDTNALSADLTTGDNLYPTYKRRVDILTIDQEDAPQKNQEFQETHRIGCLRRDLNFNWLLECEHAFRRL